MKDKTLNEKPKNTPVGRIRSGSVHATIWENTISQDGKKFKVYNITIERRYKDKDEEWQTTNSYHTNDLTDIINVAQETLRELRIVKDNAR